MLTTEEEQQRQRFYVQLHNMGLRSNSHVPSPEEQGGIRMGRKKNVQAQPATNTPATNVPATTEAQKPAVPAKQPAVTDEQVLTWMKEQGEKPITSTMIRDNFKLKNRAAARRIMKHLTAEGKVKKTEKSNGEEGKEGASSEHKRKQFVYKLV